MEWKGSGKSTSGRVLDPELNEVHDCNPWCEYSVAQMVLEESTQTAFSEDQRVFKLACKGCNEVLS